MLGQLTHAQLTHMPVPTRQLVQLPLPRLDRFEVQQLHSVVLQRPDVGQVAPRVVQQVGRGGHPHRLVGDGAVTVAVLERAYTIVDMTC